MMNKEHRGRDGPYGPPPRTDPYVQDYCIRLLPWIQTSEPHVGIRMQDFRRRKPAFAQHAELGPGQVPGALAASPQHAIPEFLQSCAELLQADRVARDRVVLTPPPVHTRQPGTNDRQFPVHFLAQLVLQFLQLGSQLLDRRDAFDGEVAFPSRPANVRETQKVERLGRAVTTV